MSITKAEEFVREFLSDSDFQVEALVIVKNIVGNLDSVMGMKDENEILKLALPAANQLGYDCNGVELKTAFEEVAKQAGPFKMLSYAASIKRNADKVNKGEE